MMTPTDINTNHIVANAGLYYVSYRLSQRYWNAVPTIHNARGYDLVCINADGSDTFTGEVKARRGQDAAGLGQDKDTILGDYWFFVTGLAQGEPLTYILSLAEVKELATHDKAGYWIGAKQVAVDEFKEAWERIGSGLS